MPVRPCASWTVDTPSWPSVTTASGSGAAMLRTTTPLTDPRYRLVVLSDNRPPRRERSGDVCAGARGLARRMVLAAGGGHAADRRPRRAHADAERAGRAVQWSG